MIIDSKRTWWWYHGWCPKGELCVVCPVNDIQLKAIEERTHITGSSLLAQYSAVDPKAQGVVVRNPGGYITELGI